MKNYTLFLLSKTWFLVIFAGLLGYLTYVKTMHTLDYLPSRIVATTFLPASIMFAGLMVGYNLGINKKKK